MNLQTCFVLSAMLLVSPGLYGQKRILFDATRQVAGDGAYWVLDDDTCGNAQRVPTPGQDGINETTDETFWDGALSAMGVDLARQGFRVETLPAGARVTYGRQDNEQDLKNYTVYVIPEPNIPFTSDEKKAILDFVRNGGGLLMIADQAMANTQWDPPGILNDLMGSPSVFGIRFNNKSKEPEFSGFDDHAGSTFTPVNKSQAIARGKFRLPASFRGLGLFGSTSMEVTGSAESHIWRKSSTVGDSKGVTFATSTLEKGKVVAVGDSSIAGDSTGCGELAGGGYKEGSFDNRTTLLNAVLWLAENRDKDRTPPSVRISAPENDARVGDPVTVTVIATDDTGVERVELSVDNRSPIVDSASPYEWTLSSATVGNGRHVLIAIAYDDAGMAATSSPVRIAVTGAQDTDLPWQNWAWLAVALLLLLLGSLIVWRTLLASLAVKVSPAEEGPNDTCAFTIDSRLSCVIQVTWHVNPADAATATLYGRALPRESKMNFSLRRGYHHVSVILSAKPDLAQPAKGRVAVIAWPKLLPNLPSSEVVADRTFYATQREEAPKVTGTAVPFQKPAERPLVAAVDDFSDLPAFGHHEADLDREVVDIVNTILRPEGADRMRLREMLADRRVPATIATQLKILDSAHSSFTKYWFEQDDRAGTWLFVPGNGGSAFTIIPFDLRAFTRGPMLNYLASLFAGVPDDLASASVRFVSAARITRGEGDSYRIIQRGALTTLGSPVHQAPMALVSGGGDRLAEDLQALTARVASLEVRLRSNHELLAQRNSGDSDSKDTHRLTQRLNDCDLRMTRLEEQLREALSSLYTLGQRITTIAAPSPGLGDDRPAEGSTLRGLIDHVASIGRRPPSTRNESPSKNLELQVQQTTQSATVAENPFIQPPPDRPPRVAPAPETQSFSFESAPAAPNGGGIPLALPPGWKERLSLSPATSSFIDASAYAHALRRAFEQLRALESGSGDFSIVHLLPIARGTETLYDVHFADRMSDEKGTVAFRCVDNPSARTPPQQFFIGFREGVERVSILCPPGEYSPVSFDFTPLIQAVPPAVFKIDDVLQPARLERTVDGRYRVAVPMTITSL